MGLVAGITVAQPFETYPSAILPRIKGGEKTVHRLIWKAFFFPKVRDCEEFKKALNHLLRDDPVLKGIKTQ